MLAMFNFATRWNCNNSNYPSALDNMIFDFCCTKKKESSSSSFLLLLWCFVGGWHVKNWCITKRIATTVERNYKKLYLQLCAPWIYIYFGVFFIGYNLLCQMQKCKQQQEQQQQQKTPTPLHKLRSCSPSWPFLYVTINVFYLSLLKSKF